MKAVIQRVFNASVAGEHDRTADRTGAETCFSGRTDHLFDWQRSDGLDRGGQR